MDIRAQQLPSISDVEVTPLEAGIIRAIAYADVFDYPLTAAEIHRYLVGVATDREAVQSVLDHSAVVARAVERHDDYYTLPGRESIVDLRRTRSEEARRLWARAIRYGRWIAGLPFVRMVAVTGALAVDNVNGRDDIDYLIVTRRGRLWLCRAMIILLVRLARLWGDTICPNYFLSERALSLDERSLFTAHELAQMVPLAGRGVFEQMIALNPWAASYLPNADGASRRVEIQPIQEYLVKRLVESLPVGWLEAWEMRRKVARFSRQLDQGQNQAARRETRFGVDYCKGHFDAHGERVLRMYLSRLPDAFKEPSRR